MSATTTTQPAEKTNEEPAKFDLTALFRELSSSPDGLNGAEAKKRLGKYGRNALEEKRKVRCSSSWAISRGRFPG
ncbi:MAG: cation-transporting P-type ATPase [Verrucomicrobiia bacterium]